jgi:hypothetical protein
MVRLLVAPVAPMAGVAVAGKAKLVMDILGKVVGVVVAVR